MSGQYDFSDEEYQNLRSQMAPSELERIEKLEKDCADLTVDYWEFYIRVENYKIGICWTPERLLQLQTSPSYKLTMCLLIRAARLRGIITR